MKSNYPIQKKLFEQVSARFSKHSKALANYKHYFPGSESNIRARFNAETSITFDHGVEVAAHYGITVDEIVPIEYKKENRGFVLTFFPPDIDTYSEQIVKRLNEHRVSSNGDLHYVINDFPAFMLTSYPMLLGLVIYYHLYFEVHHSKFTEYKLGVSFLNHPEVRHWVAQLKNVHTAYQSAVTHEYWHTQMFSALTEKIRRVELAHRFETTEYSALISNELNSIINDLEDSVKNPSKTLNPPSNVVKVFNHEGFLETNLLFSEIGLYEERATFGLMSINHPTYKNLISKKINLLGKIGGEVNPISPTGIAFFKRIRQYICEDGIR